MYSRYQPSRRLVMLAATLGLLLALGAPSGASGATPPITLDLLASGLDPLTQVTSSRDGSGRLFLVERRGTIRVFKDGAVQPGFFLDMRTMVEAGGERGLLGLAFHPRFTDNGLLFVYYTRPGGDIVLGRWRANASRSAVMLSSYVGLFTIEHSAASNHNGGGIAFSPRNGLLFVAVGDGGGGGDPENDAQNVSRNLLGKVLRINVNGTGAGPSGAYSIPSSNPFVGRAGLDVIWAYGLRNPWRISFDRANGNLFIGDVGQGAYEEIDRESYASSGGRNYGWRVMEGFHCYNASSCSLAGDTLPVAEYSHSVGKCSVTGGFVYRGPSQTSLRGHYVFADFCTGRIWTMPNQGSNSDKVLRAVTGERITSFGESDTGELYAVTIDGKLFRVLAS
jgi:glucose/arabinose dehydrogenase